MKTNRLSHFCKYAMILFIAWSFGSAKVQAQNYLLDGLSESSKTPTLAYSVRKLKAAYQGPAMRLFRSNDNDTVDVYFDANGIVSMTSPVSASKGGAATSTTLETWVGTNSAFVVIWYDQSGNGRNARNTTPIKKYNDYLITDGSAIGLLGNPVLKFDTCSAVASSFSSVVSFNVTNYNTTLGKSKYAVSGPGIGLFTYINQENGAKTNWTFTAPPTSFTKGVRLMTYPNSNTLLPSNVLMDEKGKYIGIVKSMESSTSFTFLKPAAGMVYEPNKWGYCNLPCLVFEGKLQMINENMAALRVFNGTNSGSRLVVDTFRNDLGYKYMRKVVAFNLMAAIKLEGNFSASNGAAYFGTKQTVASADRRFCVTAASTSTMVPTYKVLLGSKFSTTANSSYANGISITRSQVKADNTGSVRVSMLTTAAAITSPALGNGFVAGKVPESIKIDTIKTWDATLNDYVITIKRDTTFYTTVAGVAADALDETPIQLFGGGESYDRNFEGLGSEFIFYASANGDAPETDMDNVYVDQQMNLTSAPPTLVKPVSTLATTTATIGITVHRLGGIPGVTERGLYYGTTENTTSNEMIDAAPATGDFTKALTGLIPNTKYYFRGYAANAIKKGYSDEGSFTTYSLAPDSVKPASEITYSSFRAHWVPISAAQGTEPYTYTLQVSRDSVFTIPKGAFTIYNIPTTKLDTLVGNNIMSDSTYYFRARVNNVSGASAWTKFKSVKIATAPAGVRNQKEMMLTVAPNPVSDKIYLTLQKSAMIQVYNITGQKVMEVNGVEGKNIISVSQLQNGQYIVKVANRVAKITKQ
jgi:hypothetical protein